MYGSKPKLYGSLLIGWSCCNRCCVAAAVVEDLASAVTGLAVVVVASAVSAQCLSVVVVLGFVATGPCEMQLFLPRVQCTEQGPSALVLYVISTVLQDRCWSNVLLAFLFSFVLSFVELVSWSIDLSASRMMNCESFSRMNV